MPVRVFRTFLFAVTLLIGACSSESASAPPETPPSLVDCAEGFARNAGGLCVETTAAEPCASGTRATIGKTTCEAVGMSACPPGTKPDPSGWGCTDTLPAGGCDGATREAVGSATCVPIGDCSAAFPPAGAILVDDDFSAAQLDATHFRKIGDAIAAAAAGSTIAIDAGTYTEDLVVDKALTLAGRCPSQVRIEATPTLATSVRVVGATGVVVRGMTLHGQYEGASAYGGAEATFEDLVVDGAGFGILADSSQATVRRSKITGSKLQSDKRGGWGVSAGNGGNIDIDDAAIVGGNAAIFSATDDASILVTRTVVTGQSPQAPKRAVGVVAFAGNVYVERSIIHDLSADSGLAAEGSGRLDVRSTIVRDVHVSGSLARGHGVTSFGGGKVTLRAVTVAHAESVGLFVRDARSLLNAYDTTVVGPDKSGTVPGNDFALSSARSGVGVMANDSSKVSLEGVAVVGAWGMGITSDTRATLTVKSSLIEATRPVVTPAPNAFSFAVGLQIRASSATVDDVTIAKSTLAGLVVGKEGTVKGKNVLLRDITATGDDAVASGIAAGDGGSIDLEASAVVDSSVSGVLATKGPATIRLAHSAIHGTRLVRAGFGHGVVVLEGASVRVEHTSIFDNAGIGIAASGGRGLVVSSDIAHNPVGVHVQGGSYLVESSGDADPESNEVRVSPDSRFLGNGSRVGSGDVPMPGSILQ